MPSAENMELEAINGTTEASIQVTGVKTRLVASVSTLGLMVVDTKVSGWKTTWKVLEYTFGTMEECTKASTKTTKSTAMESIHGQTVVVMKGTGLEASSTVWEPTSCLRMAKLNSAYGKMAKE